MARPIIHLAERNEMAIHGSRPFAVPAHLPFIGSIHRPDAGYPPGKKCPNELFAILALA